MIKPKDQLTDFWGAVWKVLGIEDDVVYLECIDNWLLPELIGETDIIFLTDINLSNN